MKKYIIIVAVTADCLALCVVVWPQAKTVVKTPAPTQARQIVKQVQHNQPRKSPEE